MTRAVSRTILRRVKRNRPNIGVHDPRYGIRWSNEFRHGAA